MQALAVHATQVLGDPQTMALVVQHTLGLEGHVIAGQAVLGTMALVVLGTMVLVVQHTMALVVLGTMVLVVQHTMALVGRVMLVLVDRVTRGQGERGNYVPLYVSEVTS